MVITLAEFNRTFTDNYDTFRYYTSTVLTKNYNTFNDGITDSRVIGKVHDAYETIVERVVASAITATTIIAYIKQTIRNALFNDVRTDLIKNRIRHESYRPSDVVNPTNAAMSYDQSIANELEQYFQDKENEAEQELDYYYRSQYYSKKIFQYLERRYNEKDCYIFRCYYLMPKKMTYRKLEKQTGYSKSTCSNTIKKIKYDLRKNFPEWERNNK